MSQLRLLALLPLIGAAGCYRDASSQSTLLSSQPDQRYASGPPGGAMDPEPPYSRYSIPANPANPAAGDPVAEDDEESAPDPSGDPGPASSSAAPLEAPSGPAVAGPEPADVAGPGDPADPSELQDGELGGPGIAQAPQAPGAPGPAAAPTQAVTDVEIDATLEGYGQWVENDDYGQVWRPDATAVGVDFTPYESGGSWAYTDAGWGFACDYPWGWLPFHYGRWAWFHDYWGWVPGHRWSPAWVDWRHGGGVVGWRPRSPRMRDRGHSDIRDHRHGTGNLVRDHRHAEVHDAHWRFAADTDLGRPHIRSHLYGNPAEGLRVTSRVAAPPLRARTAIRAGDLMRNRGPIAGRVGQPDRFGGPGQLRDRRTDPRSSPPAQRIRPMERYQPYGPARSYPPVQSYRPPARVEPSGGVQPYNPGRVYQPPGRVYQPPGRVYQPPGRAQPYNPGRTYQPPGRAQPYNPGRTYQPPPRSYQPPPRSYAPSAPPSRSWSPPPSGGSSSGSHNSGSSSHGSPSSSSSSSSSHSSSGSSSHSSSSSGHSGRH